MFIDGLMNICPSFILHSGKKNLKAELCILPHLLLEMEFFILAIYYSFSIKYLCPVIPLAQFIMAAVKVEMRVDTWYQERYQFHLLGCYGDPTVCRESSFDLHQT